ncbi:hypothetical protein PIB30_083929 [Stylosanthes scabra]|uniref:Uncharacterized protein n=1 Tax=Stylosanthes scabra TaxID=79078 RepID=A0ABU6RT74_9FABA|nr:hypothetical protein [Stylosanthes scabra]
MGNAPRPPVNDPYAKTFNPGWRNHPNFGWGGQGNQGQRPHNNNFQQQQHPVPPMQPNVSQKPSQTEIAIQKLSQSTSAFVEQTQNFMNETRANFKNQEAAI